MFIDNLATQNVDAIEDFAARTLPSALIAYAKENEGQGPMTVDEPGGVKAAVSARLRVILDPQREDEVHWSFRAIPQAHGRAQLARLQAAATGAGVGPQRHLVVLRNTQWSPGKKTQEVLQTLEDGAGTVARLTEADMRTLHALYRLEAERPKGLDAWLRSRKPASRTELLRHITLPGSSDPTPPDAPIREGPLGSAPNAETGHSAAPENGRADTAGANGAGTKLFDRKRDVPAGHILLGRTPGDGAAITLPLEDLRRHAVVFAGSGSGKTVLLRRIIEECALKGVSSIVLDPNNDMVRLAMAQTSAHPGWVPGDTALAEAYGANVDVVIWTPRLSSGRPLSFAPLAGLSTIEDQDEFDVALDCAVSLLEPRARLSPNTAKGDVGRAVLKEAVRAYVRSGRESLSGLFGYLAALPEGVSQLEDAEKLAASMSQTLLAGSINDPMFGDEGTALDPTTLFTPAEGKVARVSVISFAGLPNLEQQQQFISQLQLAVFTWIKAHPAGDRPLGGLFVMDEAQNFAPSSGTTPSSATTLALASQARKYGLGLLYATQAPKGLHNRISGNCTTQFVGFLNASAQIAAANELAASRGGGLAQISKLRTGEFYVARDGHPFERMNAPFCLTVRRSQGLAPSSAPAPRIPNHRQRAGRPRTVGCRSDRRPSVRVGRAELLSGRCQTHSVGSILASRSAASRVPGGGATQRTFARVPSARRQPSARWGPRPNTRPCCPRTAPYCGAFRSRRARAQARRGVRPGASLSEN